MTIVDNTFHHRSLALEVMGSFPYPARFAPVVPLQLAAALQARGALGNYHLLLAHDVLAQPKIYQEIYANRGYTILMDNSLVELGYAMKIKDVIDAAQVVGAQYVILPDVLNNYLGTIEAISEALDQWRAIPEHARRGLGLLPVIQGANTVEHLSMLNILMMSADFAGVCIPRIIADTVGSRKWAIAYARRRYNIHLLGFSNNLMDDIACARMPNVVGIDSAVPIRAGLRDQIMSLDVPVDAGKRECYWDDPFGLPSSLTCVQQRLDVVMDNVIQVRKWLSL